MVTPPATSTLPSGSSPVVIAVVIAGLIIGLGLGTVVLLGGEDDGTVTATADDSTGPSDSDSSGDGGETADSTPIPSPSTTSSTTSSTTAPPPDGLPPGEWAAFLYAATSAGPAEAERAALAPFGDVRVLNSTAYTTLKPGLYVVYVGGFLQSSEAIEFCRAIGRNDRALCYARYLSQDISVSWNIPGTDDVRPEFVAYP